MRRHVKLLVALAAPRSSPPRARAATTARATTTPDTSAADGTDEVDTGDCIVVDMAVSSEKIALLEDLADEFNDSAAAEVDGRCIVVRPRSVASGSPRRSSRRAGRTPTPTASRPSSGRRPRRRGPASSTTAPASELAPPGTPFMLTPLVIAMPRPMAEALGWPDAAARLRRPPDARPEPGRVGRRRPPRVGTVPPRQDEPELLDERAQLHDRRVLRGGRQDARA